MNARHLSSIAALILPAVMAAQAMAPAAPSMNPVSDAARRLNTRYTNLISASADQVPADKLGYKPTEAQMTFGQVWSHLVEANFGICDAVGGTKAPNVPKLTGAESKDVLVTALKASFAYCQDVLAKTTDATMGAEVDLGFMKGSRAIALFIYLNDLADHYSQVSNYMRLNGMLPPSAQPKK